MAVEGPKIHEGVNPFLSLLIPVTHTRAHTRAHTCTVTLRGRGRTPVRFDFDTSEGDL